MLGLLSSLKENNDIMQERLNTLKKLDGAARGNVTPKFHDRAARDNVTPTSHDGAANMLNYKFHDGAAENSKLQKKASSGGHEDINPPCLERNDKNTTLNIYH